MDEYDILIDDTGTHFVYSDDLAALFANEPQTTRRVSDVEPASTFGWTHADGWLADMRRSGGPLLYASEDETGIRWPFATRQAALDAERIWLREHRGL